ncbi:MAG TPA: type 2 isopentenyl-diphosphate Delta-isomerase [Candidatus Brocadiia bacterium]|nr:type 2 isopentenyl-diphosphate Delta-isomerase [Candidatus Brocadiia bacterium]
MGQRNATESRKLDHLRLCREKDVRFSRTTTLLEDVSLLHLATTRFAPGQVDVGTRFLGRRMSAPLLIGAMTGGAAEAGKINRDLARVAQETGIGLGLGSQRAMIENPSLRKTYDVRPVAPDIVLLGNIGLCQALRMSVAQARALMDSIGADGLCVHLNPAMEIFQQEGDQDFAGGVEALARLADGLGPALIVKETGCGLSREAALALKRAGVKTVDVGGAGGTSWVKIENLRRRGVAPELKGFEEWGIPTAASLLEVRGLGLKVVASGGVATGLDMARCLALGADLCGVALPFLRALGKGGVKAGVKLAESLVAGLRAGLALTGCAGLADAKKLEPVVTGQLAEWARQRGRMV